MQKNLIIAGVVILLLGGGLLFIQSQKTGSGGQGDVVTSIKDALSKSASLSCTYTDEQGRTATTYIKNGAVRSDYSGKSEGDSGSMIMKDKKIYTWNSQKEGFMMEVPDVTGQPETEKPTHGRPPQDPVADLEKYKQYCKPAVVDDSLFTPPADVTFTDYSQMMKQAPQRMAPEQGMTEEQKQQYQQYMNQYKPQQ